VLLDSRTGCSWKTPARPITSSRAAVDRYFATALITNRLARRLILNERLAQQRGADLADQLRINKLIIRDVQDGVLVVDAHGRVHLHIRARRICWGGSCPI